MCTPIVHMFESTYVELFSSLYVSTLGSLVQNFVPFFDSKKPTQNPRVANTGAIDTSPWCENNFFVKIPEKTFQSTLAFNPQKMG